MKLIKTTLLLTSIIAASYTNALVVTNINNLTLTPTITSSYFFSNSTIEDYDTGEATVTLKEENPYATKYPIGEDIKLTINHINQKTQLDGCYQGPKDLFCTNISDSYGAPLIAMNTSIVNNGENGDVFEFTLTDDSYYNEEVEITFKLADPTGTAFNNSSDTVDISAFKFISMQYKESYTSYTSYGGYSRDVEFTAEGEVNEVPVPAAAWLFGSALAGLFFKRYQS